MRARGSRRCCTSWGSKRPSKSPSSETAPVDSPVSWRDIVRMRRRAMRPAPAVAHPLLPGGRGAREHIHPPGAGLGVHAVTNGVPDLRDVLPLVDEVGAVPDQGEAGIRLDGSADAGVSHPRDALRHGERRPGLAAPHGARHLDRPELAEHLPEGPVARSRRYPSGVSAPRVMSDIPPPCYP